MNPTFPESQDIKQTKCISLSLYVTFPAGESNILFQTYLDFAEV